MRALGSAVVTKEDRMKTLLLVLALFGGFAAIAAPPAHACPMHRYHGA